MRCRIVVPLIRACALAAALSPCASAQPATAAQREAIKQLDYLVGQWQGAGWHEIVPGKRETFTVTETIQSKLGGLALLVEGVGKAKPAGRSEEEIVHQALAVISYDAQARRYRFLAHTAEGHYRDAEIKLVEGGWQWGFEFPGGGVRYTVKLTEKGEWHEAGEMAQGGKPWRQFHEMTLRRVKP